MFKKVKLLLALLMLLAFFSSWACTGAGGGQKASPQYLYVSNAAEGSVSVIDPIEGKVAGTVKVAEKIAHGIAASPDGRWAYVALEEDSQVAVIDGQTRQEVARIDLPLSPGMAAHGVDITPDGKYLWVGARQAGENRGDVVLAELAVINAQTWDVEEVVQTGLGVPSHYAITPDGKELWVASTTVDLLWVVDTRVRQVIAAVPLVPPRQERTAERREQLAAARIIALNEVALSPDGKRAYAVGPVHDIVFVVDVPSRKVVGTVKSGRNAHGIAVSRDGKEVWTADWAGTLTILDAVKMTFKETIQLGGRPNHVAFSVTGETAYVTRTDEAAGIAELVVLDTRARKVTGTIPVGIGPHEISLEDLVVR